MISPPDVTTFKFRLDIWVAEGPMYMEQHVNTSLKIISGCRNILSLHQKVRVIKLHMNLFHVIGFTGQLDIFVMYSIRQ